VAVKYKMKPPEVRKLTSGAQTCGGDAAQGPGLGSAS
jgi:hypothetical protein